MHITNNKQPQQADCFLAVLGVLSMCWSFVYLGAFVSSSAGELSVHAGIINIYYFGLGWAGLAFGLV